MTELLRANARGRVFAIGGGEDRDEECVILKKFADLAGGSKARIVVLTTATNVPEKSVVVYGKAFKRLKATSVDFIDVAQREDAMREEAVETVKKASGIFFTGGNQFPITSLMGGTKLQSAIFEAYENDVIVAGTSAGAAMMGSGMIIKGNKELNPRMGSVEMAAGSGLIGSCVVDTHFSQRGRHGRLLTAVAHFPQYLGFGIDENTAMLVKKNKVEVFGEGAVTTFDASQMTYSDIPYVEEGQSIALANIMINVLPNGYKYDLETRTMIPPKLTRAGSQAKGKAAEASETAIAASIDQSRISTSMGLRPPLFDLGAEQAVTQTIRSISARSSIKSPAFDVGGSILNSPSAATLTFMKTFNVVGTILGEMPYGSRFRQIFSKQLET